MQALHEGIDFKGFYFYNNCTMISSLKYQVGYFKGCDSINWFSDAMTANKILLWENGINIYNFVVV